MMVETMAEGATSACVRVTPRFPKAALRRGTARPSSTGSHGAAGPDRALLDPPDPPRDLPPVIPFSGRAQATAKRVPVSPHHQPLSRPSEAADADPWGYGVEPNQNSR